jgi:hypothetical protein
MADGGPSKTYSGTDRKTRLDKVGMQESHCSAGKKRWKLAATLRERRRRVPRFAAKTLFKSGEHSKVFVAGPVVNGYRMDKLSRRLQLSKNRQNVVMDGWKKSDLRLRTRSNME